MRRTLVVLIMATICTLHLAVGTAEARGSLKVDPKAQARKNPVTISGTAGCASKKVFIYSSDRLSDTRAINERTTPMSGSHFSSEAVIRRNATRNKTFTISSRCTNARGRLSARTKLRVLAYTGLPVLPQLLLGLGLIGGGSALVRGGRRPRRGAPDRGRRNRLD